MGYDYVIKNTDSKGRAGNAMRGARLVRFTSEVKVKPGDQVTGEMAGSILEVTDVMQAEQRKARTTGL